MSLLTSVELIDASYPVQLAIRKVIEGDEIVVSRDAMDGSNANLVESAEEVLSHIDGLFEALKSDVCHDAGPLVQATSGCENHKGQRTGD